MVADRHRGNKRTHNAECTCWNCPAIDLTGKADFRSCGQSREVFAQGLAEDSEAYIVAECERRHDLGLFDPMSISFEECPQWQPTPFGYLLKDMKVMILGIDGYLGWALALWLGSLGCEVSGVDNFSRRDWVKERGAHTVVPISRMTERLRAAKEVLGININFRQIDILKERDKLREFIDEVKPEAIVHYGECPSPAYSMIDLGHASYVQQNNVLGTLGVLFMMRDLVPESSMIKLGCYDDKTEILTEEGWKLFKDLRKNDKVATRSKEERKVIFKEPNSIHEYDYEGKMYYQKNGRLDLCVTPNHRMFTQKRSNRSYKELRLESVQEVQGKRRVYDASFEWEGRNGEHFTLPSTGNESTEIKIPMDLWAKFLGWYISEGYVSRRDDRPNDYRVIIKQNKKAGNINELEEVLSKLSNILSKELKKYEDGEYYRFSIGHKQLAAYLDNFGKAPNKSVPKEIKRLHKDSLKDLLFTLIKGDGWKHNPNSQRNNFRYFTISKQLADDVQEIALKSGFGAVVTYDEAKKGYSVYICQTPRIHVNQGKITDGYIDYKGKVWCVNVGGDGIVLIRRNGKPVWCGNTMGEYGTPLTGRPLFEGMFPADAVLKWEDREWSLGGELTPRDPGSFYHISKVQDTYNIYEACKYWWLRSYDVMQGVIYGVHTPQVAADPRLRTRLDIDECVPPDTPVTTNFSVRPIDSIKVGDKVLTHTGKFRKVTRRFRRPSPGRVIKIHTPYCHDPLTVTPDHPLLVREKQRRVVNGKTEYSFSEPRWVTAKTLLSYSKEPASPYAENYSNYEKATRLREQGMNLADISRKINTNYYTVWAWFKREQRPFPCPQRKIDNLYLVKPIPAETEDMEEIDVSKEIGYGVKEGDRLYAPNPVNSQKKWSSWIPSKIKIDNDFLQFAGYYLAEGSSGEYAVTLSFGKNEQELTKNAKQALQNILQKEVSIDEAEHATRVRANSKAFAKFVRKLFGSGASNKKMPNFFLYLPTEKQKAFIRSYWQGDGWEQQRRENELDFRFTSNSKELLQQLQLVLLRFDIISAVDRREREVKLSFEGRKAYSLDSIQWELLITGVNAREFARKILGREVEESTRPTKYTKRVDGCWLMPVREIWEEEYDGDVLNLEVEKDNSYTAYGYAVHNCFGTVINRFVSQAVVGFPLTMYGAGEQIRGFIGLEDAMQCMTRLIVHPPEPGQYDVVNQMSGFYSINHLAHTVARIASKEFNLPVLIHRVENPRVEADIHPFEPIYNKLPDRFGFEPKVTLEDEIYRMLELLTQPHIRQRIEEKKHLILPRTWWSGMKKQVETLEIVEEIKYEPSFAPYRP